ncbi:MAG TPA: TonB-dependent receptor, partial [Steroidobacteraceae bacterium]|nr:TonB-dependent receptor [Steroidobacteraceae bacterium]
MSAPIRLVVLYVLSVLAQAAAAAEMSAVAGLEEVTVYGSRENGGIYLGGTTIAQQEIQQFNREAIDQALLLASGTSLSSVGARNESNVWIRGFDRWRVALYQDGIPIYLPVDNRIDFGRFTTTDLAAIQVSKGFASVIDGPGAMGGSINLVSRVVSRPSEIDGRLGMTLDSNGDYQGWMTDLFAGTRQGDWFVQGAGSFNTQEHFRLSDDFTPGTLQPAGDRIESAQRDYKINLKGGYQTAGGSDFALNFIDQVGRKDNPPPDGTIPASAMKGVKYWTWPSWDKQSLYFLSQTPLDDHGSYLKTRLYYDTFYNRLDSYDSISYTTQNTPKSFNSTYDDHAAGGSAEWSESLAGGADVVRVAAHFRWDQHNETESTRNAPGAPWYQQPWETASESTSSLALENIYHPAAAWDVIAGASYDYRHLIGADQWVASGIKPPYGYSYSYPVANKDGLNGELAAVYRYSDTGSVHFSYADRIRFPTLFEMYSTRFGTFVNNPDLQPERSHYGQIGIADTWAGTNVVVNAFLARVDDAITAVAVSPTVSENKNVGSERRSGFEIELSRKLLATLDGGINFSYLDR